MHLGPTTIDEAGASTVDLAHDTNHTIHLGIGGIEIIVVDIQPIRCQSQEDCLCQ